MMISTSGKMAKKIAAKHAEQYKASHKTALPPKPIVLPTAKPNATPDAKPAKVVKKGPHKKLASSFKGAKAAKVAKVAKKVNLKLDKKANPKALAISKKKVSVQLKKLHLKSAGFGRYHKAKGQPVTHWVKRNPKTGLYMLLDKKGYLKFKAGGVTTPVASALPTKAAPVKAAKPVKTEKHEAPKAVEKKVVKKSSKPAPEKISNHDLKEKKAKLTDAHIKQWVKHRNAARKEAGKDTKKPLNAREKAKLASSIRKLHRAIHKHYGRKTVKHGVKKPESAKKITIKPNLKKVSR